MATATHAAACERVREHVSLELDGELSQLERAALAAHLLRCADCRGYRSDVRAFTRMLRTAPLETAPTITVRRYRRAATRFQTGIAAAMALAVVGIAGQIAQSRPETGSFSTFRVSQFQTQTELEREQELIEGTSGSGTRSSGDATVR